MNAPKETSSCRLCGVSLLEECCKNIFESKDLVWQIKETLSITISEEDNCSNLICLSCYDKVILHYNFMREVWLHNKEFMLESSKGAIDFSKIRSDAAYACPNCDVDLTILLIGNPQDSDYTFQISLAVVGRTAKNHAVDKWNVQRHKNLVHPGYTKKRDINVKVEANLSVENAEDKRTVRNSSIDACRRTKRKLTEESYADHPANPRKAPKLEEISFYEQVVSSCNYDYTGTSIKIEAATENGEVLETESDYKSETGELERRETGVVVVVDGSEGEEPESEENDPIKPCPRIVCELCGARYLSRLKYEFHMERHKLKNMDKYECPLCDKQATRESLLWDHYYHAHKSSQRFVCAECGKVFRKRSRLNGHQKIRKHSGTKEIRVDGAKEDEARTRDEARKVSSSSQALEGRIAVDCNLCGKSISDLDPDAINDLVTCADCEDSTLSLMVDGNKAKVISPRQYHCSQCPKHFVRKERLEFHEMRHNENMKEFVCSTCGKDFSAENSLYEHYLFVHKGARPHICELCGKSFQLKARLKEHHRTHTGERPYQCDVCGQRCRTTNALKLHRKIHFSHNRYTCNVCDKSFSKKQNMNEHLEKHWKHDKNVSLPRLFTCPICIEDFPTYRMLKYHMMQVHEIGHQDPILTKQRPWYECPQCQEKFKHQMSLKAHKERVHEGRVNPIYHCDICDATYRIKQLLVNHIKSKHEGEKRYKCAQCEKGFNDTKSLYNHILLHTGKKPFVCEYCNASFRRKDSRDHHRRKHTGEQPYQCPECGECFSTYNNRSKHRKREHADLECPECGEKCSGQQEIRIHLNKHLGEKLKRMQAIEAT